MPLLSSPVRDGRKSTISAVPDGTWQNTVTLPGNELPGYFLPSLTGLDRTGHVRPGNE
ncbi:MAG: hypothetical protein GY749_04110 [Desulfobacteraceae bacterium]|nr:hypothetical protein [Desulfobacteraceae bacterium]